MSDSTSKPPHPGFPHPYRELVAHTARCESCERKNKGSGWTCTKCIMKFCEECVRQHGEAGIKLYHPPCFVDEEEVKTRRRRKRNRDSVAPKESSEPGTSATGSATKTEDTDDAPPAKAMRVDNEDAPRREPSPGKSTTEKSMGQELETVTSCTLGQQSVVVETRSLFEGQHNMFAKASDPNVTPAISLSAINNARARNPATFKSPKPVKSAQPQFLPSTYFPTSALTSTQPQEYQYDSGVTMGDSDDSVSNLSESSEYTPTRPTTSARGRKILQPKSRLIRARQLAGEGNRVSYAESSDRTTLQESEETDDSSEGESEVFPSTFEGVTHVVVNTGVSGLCIAHELAVHNRLHGGTQGIVLLDWTNAPIKETPSASAGRLLCAKLKLHQEGYQELANSSLRIWHGLHASDEAAESVGYTMPAVRNGTAPLPQWLRNANDPKVQEGLDCGNEDFVLPPYLMTWLKEECEGLGVQIIPITRLHEITDDFHGKVTSVIYETPNLTTYQLACKNVIFAVGASSQLLLQQLYGNALRLDLNLKHELQDWMLIKDPWPDSDPRLFQADSFAGFMLDIVNREDNTFWLGGPSRARKTLKAQPPNETLLAKMRDAAAKLLKGPKITESIPDDKFPIQVLDKGRAYTARTPTGVPIISKIPISYLDQYRVYGGENLNDPCGVFMCCGAGEEDIALSMGMAVLMRKLVNGQPTKLDTKNYAIEKYLVQGRVTDQPVTRFSFSEDAKTITQATAKDLGAGAASDAQDVV
ncbi:MAG: hypothetical protein M1820_001360 [Bogoriella megaspora]|nr:MAG: hypothetical protein M1820_001360 [Bogoriella megaspora]